MFFKQRLIFHSSDKISAFDIFGYGLKSFLARVLLKQHTRAAYGRSRFLKPLNPGVRLQGRITPVALGTVYILINGDLRLYFWAAYDFLVNQREKNKNFNR